MAKASYDQVGSVFDLVWAPLWASADTSSYTNEEVRKSCREQWLEYLAAVGWTEEEWIETLKQKVQTKRQSNG